MADKINPSPLTDAFADPVSIGAGTISLGDTVSYTDVDGGTGEGLVVSLVPQDAGWMLEVLPTGADVSVMVVPTEATVVPVEGGSTVPAVEQGNMDVPDSSMEGEMSKRVAPGIAELERAAALADKVSNVLGLLGVDTFGRGAPIRGEGGRFGGSEPGDGEAGGEGGDSGGGASVGTDLQALPAQVVTSEELAGIQSVVDQNAGYDAVPIEVPEEAMGAFQPASAEFEATMMPSPEWLAGMAGVPVPNGQTGRTSDAVDDGSTDFVRGVEAMGSFPVGGAVVLSNSADDISLASRTEEAYGVGDYHISSVIVPEGHPMVNVGSDEAGTAITDNEGNSLNTGMNQATSRGGSVVLHPDTIFTVEGGFTDGETETTGFTFRASMPEGVTASAGRGARRSVKPGKPGKRRVYKARPNPRAKVETFIASELVEDSSLNVLSDDELISELARRWAGDLVNRLNESETAVSDDTTANFGGEVEIEIEIGEGEESESKGEYPEGCDCCPMCEGGTEVSVNGITAMCPMCEGNGYVPVEDLMAEEEPVMDAPVMDPLMEMPYFADEDGVTAADQPARVPTTATYDWEGVLIVEGVPSGDGRQIAEGALSWRELPIPLMLQTVNAPGHEGAVIAGSIHEIVREGQNVIGRGYFDSGDAGSEAKRLLSEGTMRGVSADIDSVTMEFVTPDGQAVGMEDFLFSGVEAIEVLVEGRIMGATLTPFPAFQEAHVKVITSDVSAEDAVLVASGADVNGDVWRVPSPLGVWFPGEESPEEALAALVASAAATVDVPANPPRDWFLPGDMAKPEPFTVHADGRVYGLVARWGTCHIGFTDRCVNVPKSGSAYKHFRNKNVLTAEGELVATGPVFMDTVHPDLRLKASDTQAFYADTGCAVADVALYENEFGIVAAGALRPGLTPEQVRRFRGSDVSPDWRQIKGRLEVVGLLSVNVSGFIVEGLVASGATVSNPRGVWDSAEGELTTLVAAGMIRQSESEMSELRAELAAMQAEMADFREAVRPIRAQRASERFALLAQAFGDKHPETVEHGCGGACGGTDGACACGS